MKVLSNRCSRIFLIYDKKKFFFSLYGEREKKKVPILFQKLGIFISWLGVYYLFNRCFSLHFNQEKRKACYIVIAIPLYIIPCILFAYFYMHVQTPYHFNRTTSFGKFNSPCIQGNYILSQLFSFHISNLLSLKN